VNALTGGVLVGPPTARNSLRDTALRFPSGLVLRQTVAALWSRSNGPGKAGRASGPENNG